MPACRCGMPQLRLPQDHHRRRSHRLERIQRVLWRNGGGGRHRTTGAHTAGKRPSGLRGHRRHALCRQAPSQRGSGAAGSGGHRKRAAGPQGQVPGDFGQRDAGRAGARQDPPLLVPLRNLPGGLAPGNGHPSGKDAGRRGGGWQGSGGHGIHGSEDQHLSAGRKSAPAHPRLLPGRRVSGPERGTAGPAGHLRPAGGLQGRRPVPTWTSWST